MKELQKEIKESTISSGKERANLCTVKRVIHKLIAWAVF